jgi:hypothetical protein
MDEDEEFKQDVKEIIDGVLLLVEEMQNREGVCFLKMLYFIGIIIG